MCLTVFSQAMNESASSEKRDSFTYSGLIRAELVLSVENDCPFD